MTSYAVLPPTTNALLPAQRTRLLRSTRKLGAVLGATPLLLESDSESSDELPSRPPTPPVTPRTKANHRKARVFPSPSSSQDHIPLNGPGLGLESPLPPVMIHIPLPHAEQPKSAPKQPLSRPLLLRLRSVPVPLSHPTAPEPQPLSPLSPTFTSNNAPTTKSAHDPRATSLAQRRKKLAKLTRTLGENVPPELVFPGLRASQEEEEEYKPRPGPTSTSLRVNVDTSVHTDAPTGLHIHVDVPSPKGKSSKRPAPAQAQGTSFAARRPHAHRPRSLKLAGPRVQAHASRIRKLPAIPPASLAGLFDGPVEPAPEPMPVPVPATMSVPDTKPTRPPTPEITKPTVKPPRSLAGLYDPPTEQATVTVPPPRSSSIDAGSRIRSGSGSGFGVTSGHAYSRSVPVNTPHASAHAHPRAHAHARSGSAAPNTRTAAHAPHHTYRKEAGWSGEWNAEMDDVVRRLRVLAVG